MALKKVDKEAPISTEGKTDSDNGAELLVNLGEEAQEKKDEKAQEKVQEQEKAPSQEDPFAKYQKIIDAQEKLIANLSDMVKNLVNKPDVKESMAKDIKPLTFSTDVFDKDDILEKDVLFFAPISQYGIFMEVDGKTESVMFAPIYRFLNRDKKIECLSGVRVTSKKILNILLNHPSYGIKFYKNGEESENIDVEMFEFFQTASDSVKSLNQADLYRECKKYDIDVTQDISDMRKKLAVKIGKDQYERSLQSMTQKAIQNTELFEEFKKDK